MSNALVAVPAGDKEHGRTVRHGTNNSSSCNSCAGRVDLAARAGITSQGATIARASGRRGGGVSTSGVGTCTRKRTASCKRARSVDQVGQIVDCGILVVPERISRVAKLSRKLCLQILGDREHRHGGDEALVLGSVERLQAVVLNIADRDVETICNGLGQVVEDLATTVVLRHEWVVQWPLEANLAHEAILRDLGWNAARGSDHPGQTGRDAAARSSRRGDRRGLLNDAGGNEECCLGVGGRWPKCAHRSLRDSG